MSNFERLKEAKEVSEILSNLENVDETVNDLYFKKVVKIQEGLIQYLEDTLEGILPQEKAEKIVDPRQFDLPFN